MPGTDSPMVEGVQGNGQLFMLGERAPEPLPEAVLARVEDIFARAEEAFGPVRLEWVDDGHSAWVIQIHCADGRLPVATFSPGTPENGWIPFRPSEGLARLRLMVEEAAVRGQGIEVIGEVGLTSHVGDVIREGGVPGRRAAS
jgi:hypothetical protein